MCILSVIYFLFLGAFQVIIISIVYQHIMLDLFV